MQYRPVCNVYRSTSAWLVEGQCPISRGARHDVTTRLDERARCRQQPPRWQTPRRRGDRRPARRPERRRRLHRCRRLGGQHWQRQRGRAHRGTQTRKRSHRVRPPTTTKRQLVGRPPDAPRPLLPHHRRGRQLARQFAAGPHSAPDRRPIHRPIRRPIHRPVLGRHRRRVPLVRAAHQRHHHLLGQFGFPHGITVGPGARGAAGRTLRIRWRTDERNPPLIGGVGTRNQTRGLTR